MTERRNHLTLDLKVLRYLDALDAGDPEAVAIIWEEASHDPELDRALTALDHALFVEEAGENRGASAHRDRGTLQNHRQRGVTSAQRLSRRRRLAVITSVIGGLAAAGLLAFFAWHGRDGRMPGASPLAKQYAHQVPGRADDDGDLAARWREHQRVLDGGEMPAFNWPLAKSSSLSVSTAIHSDLFE